MRLIYNEKYPVIDANMSDGGGGRGKDVETTYL